MWSIVGPLCVVVCPTPTTLRERPSPALPRPSRGLTQAQLVGLDLVDVVVGRHVHHQAMALTRQFLTDGRYDPGTALFVTPAGKEKHLVATDHVESPDLCGLSVEDLFDIVARHRLHFDQSRQVGVVFHMISCLTELGRVGLTAVGDSPSDADARYRRAEEILLGEAKAALVPRGLPAA
jgi:hypothetical protein